MSNRQKYYRTVIEVEVLSEEPYDLQSLDSLHEDITTGDCSGRYSVKSQEELTPEQAAAALTAQGSSPDFFYGLAGDVNND